MRVGDGAVFLSVVAHDRVEKKERRVEERQKFLNDADLLFIAKKTSVQAVKGQPQILPCVYVCLHVGSIVIPVADRKA